MELFKFFSKNHRSSSNTAKERLNAVLQGDRAGIPAAQLNQIKEELVSVMVKYMDLDPERTKVTLERGWRTENGQQHSENVLIANIPIVKMRRA